MRSKEEWKSILMDQTQSCDMQEAKSYLESIANRPLKGWSCTDSYKEDELIKEAAEEILASFK